MMRIDNLANHQHLLPQLAAWHAAEWRHSVPDTPDRQALLLSRTSSGAGLPQTFLALIDDTPAGFVSLLANALPDDAPPELCKLTPWLAGLLVDPKRRRQGVGNALVRHACSAALAAGMLGDSGQGVAMAAAIIGGTLTAGTHFGKAGTRAAVNTSPEPFTNIGLSIAEESMVAGGLALAIANPIVFLLLLLVFIVLLVFLIRFILKGLSAIIRRLSNRAAVA